MSEVRNTEEILGLGECPLCGGKTEIGWEVEPDTSEVLFHAVCVNPNCGCNSGKYKSIRETQDKWAMRSAAAASKAAEPAAIDETGYTTAKDKMPTRDESIFRQEDNARFYRLMNIITYNATSVKIGYFDGSKYRDFETNAAINGVKCYKYIDGRYAYVTREQAEAMRG